jgi:hypothetical protein
MISKRCKRRNLLNYLKQKNIDYNIEYEQIMEKNTLEYYHWRCTFLFNGKSYSITDVRKKECLDALVDEAVSDIYNYLF